jgi:hypothetical protein
MNIKGDNLLRNKKYLQHFGLDISSATHERSLASAAVELNSSVFWVITRRDVV